MSFQSYSLEKSSFECKIGSFVEFLNFLLIVDLTRLIRACWNQMFECMKIRIVEYHDQKVSEQGLIRDCKNAFFIVPQYF